MMKTKQHLGWLACIALAGALATAGGHAAATVVYDNGPPDGSSARASDFDFPAQAADNFTLGSDAVVRSVVWYGIYAFGSNVVPAADDFTIRFFANANGAPAVLPVANLHVGDALRLDTGISTSSGSIFEYRATVPDTALAGGTAYYLSVVANTVGIEGSWAWFATGPEGAGSEWYRSTDGDGWSATTARNFAFSLNAAPVPETSSQAMLLAGLAVVAAAALQRR